jgi:hypothetical protein
MTYKESLDIAFLKTDSESTDYDAKLFPILANEAQMYIAKYGTHIIKAYFINVANAPFKTELPLDFYRVAPMVLVDADDELRGIDYCIAEDDRIVINETGRFTFYYYALPKDLTKLTEAELENYEYEVADHTHMAIPSYIGYQLVKTDDVQLAQILMDEWNKYMSLFDDKVKVIKRRIQF